MYQVTLQVTEGKGSTKPCTFNVENERLINSIYGVTVKNNVVSKEDMKKLQEAAARSGDAGVLEECDLSSKEKIKLANLNGYGEYYDIKLSDDGKYYKVTVKKTGIMTKNPTLGIIKKDFGVKNNVFVQGREIPYGNEELLAQRKNETNFETEKQMSWDAVKLQPGDTINIPVNEVSIKDSPSGGLTRFFG